MLMLPAPKTGPLRYNVSVLVPTNDVTPATRVTKVLLTVNTPCIVVPLKSNRNEPPAAAFPYDAVAIIYVTAPVPMNVISRIV